MAKDDVSTDALVERLGELRTILTTDEHGDRYWARQELAGLLPRIIAAIEALQRSNAEKDEALWRIKEGALGSMSYATIHSVASKALSHSSETKDESKEP